VTRSAAVSFVSFVCFMTRALLGASELKTPA
jgi:hypothetical protein